MSGDRTRSIVFAFVLFAISTTVAASSREHNISQAGRIFSKTELTVRVGERVTFINDDDVSHNVISSSRGNEFDLGEQEPGLATPVTFTAPGKVHVHCLIHPRMRLTIKVTE